MEHGSVAHGALQKALLVTGYLQCPGEKTWGGGKDQVLVNTSRPILSVTINFDSADPIIMSFLACTIFQWNPAQLHYVHLKGVQSGAKIIMITMLVDCVIRTSSVPSKKKT